MLTNTIDDLIIGVLNHGPDVLAQALTDADLSDYKKHIESERLDYPTPVSNINPNNWFIPQSYKNFNIEEFCLTCCVNETETARVKQELELYKKYNMMSVLQTVKYIVDTLRKHNIVWGVGRGSSVASYVLFLLGVHKIDSIKYNIPLEEFFKEI